MYLTWDKFLNFKGDNKKMSGIIGRTVPGITPGVSQVLAIGSSSAASNAVGSNTTAVQLIATVACFISVGASPTAVANTSMYVPANIPIYIGVGPGQKIAAIQSTGAGSLYITEAA